MQFSSTIAISGYTTSPKDGECPWSTNDDLKMEYNALLHALKEFPTQLSQKLGGLVFWNGSWHSPRDSNEQRQHMEGGTCG